MSINNNTIPFHLVSLSPWPLMASIQLFNSMFLMAKKMNNENINYLILLSMIIMISISMLWWRDIMRESTFEGMHTKEVVKGLKMGMVLFITSEIFFFLSFFWAYFHMSLSPDIFIGQEWPMKGIKTFNPMQIPFLNTLILISSGITLTASHHYLMVGKNKSLMFLMKTILLGIYFSLLQYIEYKDASFSISDSVYGSTFFMATGFHGIHVLIGTTFLMICFFRMMKNQMSSYHHLGFETAAWYWHFVDVVWLFLYICIYWFGK